MKLNRKHLRKLIISEMRRNNLNEINSVKLHKGALGVLNSETYINSTTEQKVDALYEAIKNILNHLIVLDKSGSDEP